MVRCMGNALSPSGRERIIAFEPLTARESVTEFCRREGVSRTTFYRIRRAARERGVQQALRPASRAPHRPHRRWGPGTDERIAALRDRLLREGLEAGPWSIWWLMSQGGSAPAPSRATIARRLRALGLVTPAPRKRPRTSFKRFARTRANELWQLDGIQWDLAGRTTTLYQVVDDCTRVMVALHAATGQERAEVAIEVLSEAFARWGAPAAVLSDNGTAFNTHRRGRHNRTETWLAARGVRPISGTPGHPRTQGKVERAHQGVQAWLAARTPHTDLNHLQSDLDAYRHYYNTERQHQGLGIALTPMTAWHQVPRATNSPHPIDLDRLGTDSPLTLPDVPDTPRDHTRKVASGGNTSYGGRRIYLGPRQTGRTVTVRARTTHIDILDDHQRHIATIPWPPPPHPKGINATRPPYATTPPPHPTETTTPTPTPPPPTKRNRSHDTRAQHKS